MSTLIILLNLLLVVVIVVLALALMVGHYKLKEVIEEFNRLFDND